MLTECQYFESFMDIAELEAKAKPLDSVDARILENLRRDVAEYESRLEQERQASEKK